MKIRILEPLQLDTKVDPIPEGTIIEATEHDLAQYALTKFKYEEVTDSKPVFTATKTDLG